MICQVNVKVVSELENSLLQTVIDGERLVTRHNITVAIFVNIQDRERCTEWITKIVEVSVANLKLV